MSPGRDQLKTPGPRVLVVDDEPAVLRSIKRLLGREGYVVDDAPSAEAALVLLEGGAIPHVVISDFRMPGMTGVAFLSEVLRRWPVVQRVLMTGHADVSAIEEAVNESRIYRFLAKPFDDTALIATLRSAVEHWRLEQENARLIELTAEQNRRLLEANADLEMKIQERTVLLSRAKREWEVGFDAILDPMVIIDQSYRIVRGNLALAKHMGTDIRRAPGHFCHELRAQSSEHKLERAENGVCIGCPVTRARAQGTSAEAELLTTSNDRSYQVGAFPIGDGSDAMVCVYRDLTEQRALQRQLTLADKLSAMGLLASGVAHEINNPLGAILAFTQILLREEVDAAENQEYLKEIEASAVRCKEIVARLLSFARQAKRDDARRFNVNDVVAETTFLVEKSYLPHCVTLERDLATDLHPVEGNRGELAQVLLNLITNARDAIPATGGTIRVRTRNVDDGTVELVVSDSGCGIPEREIGKIFDPFFTTKPEGKGTGLGLAVSYGIVRAMKGNIRVRSRVGEGTDFHVVLPRHPEGN